MNVLERRRRVVAHVVRPVHATSEQPVAVRATFLGPTPPGWALAMRDGAVVVSRVEHRPPPPSGQLDPPPIDPRDTPPNPPVVVRLTLADTALLPRIANAETDVALTAAELKPEFEPKAATVEVRLVDAKDKPKKGATVVASGSGVDVPLKEDPKQPGTYRANRVWGKGFKTLDIKVGVAGAVARRVVLDVTSPVMRIRLVDPT